MPFSEEQRSRAYRAVIACLEEANDFMKKTGLEKKISVGEIAEKLGETVPNTKIVLRVLAQEGHVNLFAIEGVASQRHEPEQQYLPM